MNHLAKTCLSCIFFFLLFIPLNGQEFNTIVDIAWNADGTYIAVSHLNGCVEVHSVSTNEIIWTSSNVGSTYVDWHPTKPTELAYAMFDGSIYVVDVATNKVELEIPIQGFTHSIEYDTTDTRLATSQTNGQLGISRKGYIRVFDSTTGEENTIYEPINRNINNAKWDKNGQQIIALGEGELYIWNVFSGDITQTISFIETATDEIGNYEFGHISAFDINPINNELVIADSIYVSFWQNSDYTIQRLENLVFSARDIEWNADGSLVATATGTNREVNIIDPTTGQIIDIIETSDNVEVLAWNPVRSQLVIGDMETTIITLDEDTYSER